MSEINQIPHAIDIERAVLGAIIFEPTVLYSIESILNPEYFYDNANKIIYKSIEKLSSEKKSIDYLTISEELKTVDKLDSVGGAYYLSTLTNNVFRTDNTMYHVLILQEKYIRRKYIESSIKIQQMAYSGDTDIADIMEYNEKLQDGLLDNIGTQKSEHIKEVSIDNLDQIYKLRSSEVKSIGLSTLFDKIDKTLYGLCNGDLILLAARPSMGKTAFAIKIMNNLAIQQNIPVGFLSLEMSSSQIEYRQKSMLSGIDHSAIKTGIVTDSQLQTLEDVTHKISEAPIYIDDSAGLSIYDFKMKARRMKYKYDVEVIIVDYIQLMTGDTKNGREREVSMISQSLKQVAKELSIPIIGLSQLNRTLENRTDKTPRLSDLRESGSLEQDADVVMFLHRPEYYGITEFEGGDTTIGKAIIKVSKNRNGITGDTVMRFLPNTVSFEDIQPDFSDNNTFTDF